ncbi:SIR2 family protein [Leucobacter sp. W1038]|uniref:SIR2 family protein n=1 Tax=Leucobacter sp. W1038 TaxID=3438281 RepID=UPI003D96B836
MTRAWQAGGISLPQELDRALSSDKLVFFVGAGVSSASPSNLPGFLGLAADIANDMGHSDWVPEKPDPSIHFDEIMGRLNDLHGDAHARVSARLRPITEPNTYHEDLIALATVNGNKPRIVTTNFDLLFEEAARRAEVELSVHHAPALPLGNDFSGLVHLHGPIDPTHFQRMVLTDQDFGQAYITEGWATQFLTRMLEEYVTVFVGYSADDVVMRYLARALPTDGGTRFAFMREDYKDEMTAKWQRLDVSPVLYPKAEGSNGHARLQTFFTNWRERVTSTSEDRYDAIVALIDKGPSDRTTPDPELSWLLSDEEYSRHFVGRADPTEWMRHAEAIGILDVIFEPANEQTARTQAMWSAWVTRSISVDRGESMLEILAKHRGQMSQQLWFDVFRQLYEGYQPHDHLRKLLILLTAARSDSDDSQLSLLIQKLAEVDPEAAEVLLHQLLTARLEFTSHRGILGRPDFLTTEFVFPWHPSSIRKVWPQLLQSLRDPDQLLSLVLSLIAHVETTTAFFDGTNFRNRFSTRRYTVDGNERFLISRDEHGVLLVDVARDLLREYVRHGRPERANNLLDSSSELAQRLGIDALTESRPSEADSLIGRMISQGLILSRSHKPEVFRLLKEMYPHASAEICAELLNHIQETSAAPGGIEVSDSERFNAVDWLTRQVKEDDPAHQLLREMKQEHPEFSPREEPNLDATPVTFARVETPSEAEGRFRGMTPAEVANSLKSDPDLDDIFEQDTLSLELNDFFENEPFSAGELLAEFFRQGLYSYSAWAVVLLILTRPGADWEAEPLLTQLRKLPRQQTSAIAQNVAYTLMRPTATQEEDLEQPDERCKLLFGLWRLTLLEGDSDIEPRDPNEANSTARGVVANAFLETVFRTMHEQKKESIDPAYLLAFSEFLEAQDKDVRDPSPMMLARYAAHIQHWDNEWFDRKIAVKLNEIADTPQSRSFWAGIFTANNVTDALMVSTRSALRTGWLQVSTELPGSIEAYIDLHSAQFAYYTEPEESTWADPFTLNAPAATRARWIRNVAHRVSRVDSFPEVLYSYWKHRLDKQPPLTGTEQRALLSWITVPSIDIDRAVDLFIQGPEASPSDEDRGFDYYDPGEFPIDHPSALLKVGLHLLRGRTTLPSFLQPIVEAAKIAPDDDRHIVKEVWSELLRLGYFPARDFLDD